MEEVSAFTAYGKTQKKQSNKKTSQKVTKTAKKQTNLKLKQTSKEVAELPILTLKAPKKRSKKSLEDSVTIEEPPKKIKMGKPKVVIDEHQQNNKSEKKLANVSVASKVTESKSNGGSKEPSGSQLNNSSSAIPAHDSVKEGLKAFEWILNPLTSQNFLDKFWETAPCLIKRSDKKYFQNLISFEIIDQMLIQNHIEFTKNIDITSYKKGVRETHNPDGRALPPVVWEHYASGCSIRLLNPQTYISAMMTLNSTLQEYFHCMVGANVYLTPPNSQGFAPHYDDIEAFVLQIEGKKRWKLYNPRTAEEGMPRYSSCNFSHDEIGEPIFDEVLEPGDVLYFPRGTIHQAFTEKGYHSLHITLSVYQKQSYADLFEALFPMMLSNAISNSVELRRGLPLNIWRNMGVVNSDVKSKERTQLLTNLHRLLRIAINDLPFDAAVDQVAKKFQHDALPPQISSAERVRTIFGSKNRLNPKGEVITDFELELNSSVRLLRANIIRLVEEEGKFRIYFYVDNSKEYHEFDPNFLEIEEEDASIVDMLVKTYPEHITVDELPSDEDEKKLSVTQVLFERGLLMLEEPFDVPS